MGTVTRGEAVRQWRRAIGFVQRSREVQGVLAQIPAVMAGHWRCGLYVVDDEHGVRFNDLQPDSEWQDVRSAEAHGRRVVNKKGRMRRVQAEKEDPALGLRLGVSCGLIVEMPFAAGVLVAAYDGAGAMPQELSLLADLAVDCELLFGRLKDLRRLEEREDQLRQAQKLAMVGQLSAGVIHEVNNALTVVLGQSELLQLDPLDGHVREGLEMICQASRNAQGVVGRMLEMTHQRDAPRMYFALNPLVEQTLQLVRRQLLRKNIHLEVELAADLPQIFGVPEQIQQVVLNLVQNSRDAILGIRRHGTVYVRTRAGHDRLIVEVEDDGPGIPLPLRQRIFEPFVTTKEKGEGTGLGLSVCQSIARDHQGILWVGDVERGDGEEGTRLVLELPLAASSLSSV